MLDVLLRIEQKLDLLLNELMHCRRSCHRMDSHIDMVETLSKPIQKIFKPDNPSHTSHPLQNIV